MTTGLASIREDYLAHPEHGPLPAMLLVLTVATGVIDAVSIVGLGRVFVANMTGNIVFIGFALAGAPGFSLIASLIALVAFLAGAGLGGGLISKLDQHRTRLLSASTAIELALMSAATITASIGAQTSQSRDITLAWAAAALGLQNAVVRRIAIPDLTTTLLTMTLTGIAADLHARNFRTTTRRIMAVVALAAGALGGALLVLRVSVSAGLAAATALIAMVTISAITASRSASLKRPVPHNQRSLGRTASR